MDGEKGGEWGGGGEGSMKEGMKVGEEGDCRL